MPDMISERSDPVGVEDHMMGLYIVYSRIEVGGIVKIKLFLSDLLLCFKQVKVTGTYGIFSGRAKNPAPALSKSLNQAKLSRTEGVELDLCTVNQLTTTKLRGVVYVSINITACEYETSMGGLIQMLHNPNVAVEQQVTLLQNTLTATQNELVAARAENVDDLRLQIERLQQENAQLQRDLRTTREDAAAAAREAAYEAAVAARDEPVIVRSEPVELTCLQMAQRLAASDDTDYAIVIVSHLMTAMNRYTEAAQRLNACLICLDQPRTHVALPCGHVVACATCAPQVSGQCPCCRGNLTGPLKLIFG